MLKFPKIFRRIQLILAVIGLVYLVDACQGKSNEVSVTIYEHPNYEGRSKQITVNRCHNILDFDDEASAIRTSGCVTLYEDTCCQGANIRVTRDSDDFGIFDFHDRATSMSPCGFYQAPLPDALQETWLGHDQTMYKVVEDGDIAIFYNFYVSGDALANHQNYLKRLWAYVKTTYGTFGREGHGGLISAFMHANVQGDQYGFNSIQSHFDVRSSCRNLIDLVGGRDGWSNNLTGIELDVFTHEISHIVEGSSKGVHGSPSYRLWGDSKWAEIFMYDVYHNFGMMEERDRIVRMWENNSDNFPRPNTYWFRDWFYPVYQTNGGARVLKNYFNLLAQHYPRKASGWEYIDRSINLGEFIHFFSGAAGRDLQTQARIAFGIDAEAERELRQAKIDFPDIRYY